MVTLPALRASATIPRALPDDPAQDYSGLKAEAIALVQACAGGSWTDYNAHDPGVTILEQLCYALTDLGYRADFRIEDLLAAADGSLPALLAQHPPWRAFPTEPVGVPDFRRLLIDRVPGLGNAWLTPRPVGSGHADGLYDIRLQPTAPLPGIDRAWPHDHVAHPARLAERARRLFLHHRPLGEDIGTLKVLKPLRTLFGGAVQLEPGADPEQVMAEALYRMALALAPEPRRRGLPGTRPDMVPADLFDGPLMLNGFLPAAALGDKPAVISVAMLTERVTDVAGVRGIRDAWLWVEETGFCEDGTCAIDDDHMPSLDAGMDDAGFALELSVDGRPCVLDRDEVARRLHRFWEEHRRVYPLRAAYAAAFPLPTGRRRDLVSFAPVAAQFPRIYGLGDGRNRPEDAAAGQLAGYLAIFEMLMVDYCDRLADLAPLMAGEPGSETPLGGPDFRARIAALNFLSPPTEPDEEDAFARMRSSPAQREALLDFLLALFGEDAAIVPIPPPFRKDARAAGRHRIAVKQALLGRLDELARRRGRGIDYRRHDEAARQAGPELRLRLLLGEHEDVHRHHRHHRHDRRLRARVVLIEQVMLRSRARDRAAAGRRHGLAVEAVVHVRHEALHDRDYRREVEAAVRAAVPVHLAVRVHFVEREHWRHFRRLRRRWLEALRHEHHEEAELLSAALSGMFEHWPGRTE